MIRSFFLCLVVCVAVTGCGKKHASKLPRMKLPPPPSPRFGVSNDPEQQIALLYLTDWRSLPTSAEHVETMLARAKQALADLEAAGVEVIPASRIRVKLSADDLKPDGTIVPGRLEQLRLAGVEELDLISLPLTDAGMQQLQALRCLKELRIQSDQITDAGFEGLKPLVALQDFHCFNEEGAPALAITGEGFKNLERLKALRDFDVRRANVKGSSLPYLSSLQAMTTLYLDDNRITDSGLTHLQSLNKLRYISLEKNQIVGSGLRDFVKFGDLESLSLDSCPIADANAEALGALHVKTLFLNNTPLTNKASEAIAKNKALKVLRLANTSITNEGVKALAGLPELEVLDLREDKITDGILPILAACPKVRKILVTKTLFFSLAAADKWKKAKPGSEVVFFVKD
jgi:hypothetical protein